MKYYIFFLKKKPRDSFQHKIPIEKPHINAFSSIYIQETNKIYYIYHNKTKRCLSKNLYQGGINIHNFKELEPAILSAVEQKKEYKQIRRRDFKYIIKLIKQAAQEQISSAIIHLDGLYLILTYKSQGYVSVQKKKIFSSIKEKEQLIQLFFSSLQKYLLDSQDKNWKKFYHKAQTWSDSHMLNNIISPINYLHWSGVSFKTIIALQHALEITKSYEKEQSSTFSLYKPLSFQHIEEIPSKLNIRTICILCNLAGSELPHLKSSFYSIQKVTQNKKNITCIMGTFDSNTISEIFQHQQAQKCFDLVIYQGHSIIENNSIAWLLSDKSFILPINFFKYYIHLSCISIHKNIDIYRTCFYQGVLPSTWLPDTDFTSYILSFINQVQKNKTL